MSAGDEYKLKQLVAESTRNSPYFKTEATQELARRKFTNDLERARQEARFANFRAKLFGCKVVESVESEEA